MQPHYYTPADRRGHLEALVAAIYAFLPVLSANERYREAVPAFEAAAERALSLIKSEFTQRQLSDLSASVPRLFWPNGDWCLPTREVEGDSYCDPDWFARVEPLAQRVDEAAYQLRIIGWR
jgi:hypothetical protein